MPAALTLTSRLIGLEDLALTTDPLGESYTGEVLGLGPTTLSKIPAVLYSQFPSFASDSLARSSGLKQGAVYYNTTASTLVALGSPKRETPSGSVNGSNLIFTLSEPPQIVQFMRNGAVLTEGAGLGYTRASQTITMLGGFGTCNVLGQSVTRTIGTAFKPSWDGMQITINAVAYRILKVLDQNTIFLASSAGTLTAVSWSCSGAPVAGDQIEAVLWTQQ